MWKYPSAPIQSRGGDEDATCAHGHADVGHVEFLGSSGAVGGKFGRGSDLGEQFERAGNGRAGARHRGECLPVFLSVDLD